MYVLLCEDESYYTGHTEDVEERFRLHQLGFGGRYTRLHRPVEVLLVEEFATRGEAVRREREIKRLGRDGRRKLIRERFSGVEWVFFDLGSTLTDEGVFERFMFREVFKFLVECGVQVTRRRFKRLVRDAVAAEKYRGVSGTGIYGSSHRNLLMAVVAGLPNGEQLIPQVLYHYSARVKSFYIKKQRLKKGVKLVLRSLKKKYNLGLVANQPREARELLCRLGLDRYFKLVVISDEVGMGKPNPEIFEVALKLAGCPPEKAVMVGDRLDNDVAPAKKLGIKTICIKFGLVAGQKPSCELEKADCSVRRLTSLLELL